MTFDLDDTIAAIASPPGGSLRGIVRLSGMGTLACMEENFRSSPRADIAALAHATCLSGSFTLPRALGDVPARLYLWPTERSYTRQPAAELHLPGSPPILDAALAAVCRAGARLARPGEFTLRAFLAGRLDLTQAEAVLGVIDARSNSQLQSALEQLAGGLAQPLHDLREQLLNLLAHLEAGLDFADEDIEFISPGELDAQLAAATDVVQRLARQMHSRQETSELPRVVLVGEPNAGKSSLFNALTGIEAALVADRAGTTRDFVSRRLELSGAACLLIDTAGVQPAAHQPIAAAAQIAAQAQTRQADLLVLCLDASRGLTPWELAEAARLNNGLGEAQGLVVWTKCDLPLVAIPAAGPVSALRTSSRAEAGLSEVRRAIGERLQQLAGESVVASTAARCRAGLDQSAAALERARGASVQRGAEELAAAEIRIALDGLGQVVGAVYTDDVLDRVFSRFCIGK
ncbi:MAG: GTPase [Pirellulaceae bacterium]